MNQRKAFGSSVARFADIAIEKSIALIARVAGGRLTTVASGLEHIPTAGPALIIARHYHHLYDGVALFAALPRPFHIMVTLDWVANARTRMLLQTLTRIARWPALLRADALVHAQKRGVTVFSAHDVSRYQRSALRQAVALLVEGRMVVIFPEGYPNIDPIYTPKTAADEFLPFKPGFVAVVSAAEKRLRQDIPIIPVGLHYVSGTRWIAHMRVGSGIYRKRFNATAELVSHAETAVKQLSAPNG